MSSSFVAVNVFGGLDALVGGGLREPRKSGGSESGKAHYKRTAMSNNERNRIKKKKK